MKSKFLLRLVIVMILPGCGSSRVHVNWSDPDISIDLSKLTKVLVVGYMNSQSSRRNVEDQLSAVFNGKAVPSYKYFVTPAEEEQLLDKQLEKEGFDGGVVMRLIETKERKHFIPGRYPVYYNSFGSFYHLSRQQFYYNSYYTIDKLYYIEINVYSFKRNKLIWTGITEIINPAKEKNLVEAVVKTVYNHMKKHGFLVGEINK